MNFDKLFTVTSAHVADGYLMLSLRDVRGRRFDLKGEVSAFEVEYAPPVLNVSETGQTWLQAGMKGQIKLRVDLLGVEL